MPSDREEIKLIAKSNTQIKFYNSNRYSDVTNKLVRLLTVLGATIIEKQASSNRKKPARRDIYFDHEWFLAKRMQSVSIRDYTAKDRKALLTLKLDEGAEHLGSISLLGRKKNKTE